jgi:hypothetical protein
VELYNEVKFDFSSATALANAMRSAATDAARFRREVQGIQRDTANIARNLTLARMPGLPGSAQANAAMRGQTTTQAGATTAQRAALFGTAAAGSAFFYRATSLASPAAMQRFHLAIDDTTAVIGHQMIPALEQFTKLIRGLGNFLANHPMLSKAIAGGALAGTGLALAGSIYKFGAYSLSGLRGMAADATGFFRGTATQAAASAGGGALGNAAAAGVGGVGGAGGAVGTRAILARAQVDSFRAEERAMQAAEAARAAERASGGLGASPEVTRAGQAAEAEAAAIRAARNVRTPPALPAVSRLGRFGRLLGTAGRFAGSASEIAGPLAMFYSTAMSESPGGAIDAMTGQYGLQSLARSVGIPEKSIMPTGGQLFSGMLSENARRRNQALFDVTKKAIIDDPMKVGSKLLGFDINPTNWFGGGKSSYGASAQPAEYQDVLSSFFAMRQSIASGSATSETSKDNTDALKDLQSAIQDLTRQMATVNSGESNRGTRG